MTQPETKKTLAAFMESLSAADNPEKELLVQLIAQVRDRQPDLADAIQFCAIPRRFNAEIIGVLRKAPEDRETNQRLLAGVLDFSFVRTRSAGFYSYDDTTRDALLQDWTENRQEQYDQLNQSLVSYYQTQHDRTRVLARDLTAVSPIIGRANPTRYVQLASAAETRLVAPLLEALYHETLRSAEDGYNKFERYFEDYESKGRFSICDSLLTATRSYLEHLPPQSGRGKWLKWIHYWKARLERELRRPAEAEALLRQLFRQLDQSTKAKTEQDTKLRLWALGELGLVLQDQWKLREASDTYLAAVTLAEQTSEDPYNLPVWHYRLASLCYSLDEYDKAALSYQKAIESAKDSNLFLAVHSRLDFSAVLFASGRQGEAFAPALEALHIARTRLPDNKTVHRFVIQQFMSLLARHEPLIVDTLFSEGKTLLAEADDPTAQAEFVLHYVAQLRQGGQLKRADQELSVLETSIGGDETLKPGLLLEKALLREEQGRLMEVMSGYDELAQKAEESGNVWHYAAALSNRGMASSKLARWEPAEKDLQRAISHWQKVGYEKLAAYVSIPLATAFRKQGDIPRAEEILREVPAKLGPVNTIYLGEYYEEYADLLRDQACTTEARKAYEKSLEIIRLLDQREQAARILMDLAGLAADQGEWKEAQEHTAEAHDLWKQLANFDRHRPRKVEEEANQLNARGALFFSSESENRGDTVRQAVNEFRKACNLVPKNCWFQLNRAYACAELGDWAEAIDALEAAIAAAPRNLASSVLYERLAQYRSSQGEKLLASGNYDTAATFYAESKTHLAGKISLDQQAVFWLRLGDSLLKRGDFDKAETEYREGLKQLEALEFWNLKSSFHARIGLTAALRQDLGESFSHLESSIDTPQVASETVAGDIPELVRDFSELVTSSSQYQTFNTALQRLIDNPLLESSLRQRISEARFEFIRRRYELVRRSPELATGTEVISDIVGAPRLAIEADAQLFPQDVEIPHVKRLIESDLPMMQDFFHKYIGVKIPGMVIRANETFPKNYYALSLNGTPLADGYVFPEKGFCFDVEACRKKQIDGELVALPDGLRGLWVTESNAKAAESQGLVVLNVYQYMLLHLQLHLRLNLPTFLGIQDVVTMYDEWAKEGTEDRNALWNGVANQPGALLRLVQTLQRLVAEEVPVRNLEAILASFVEANSKQQEPADVVEKVRMALVSELTTAIETHTPMGLTEDSEATINRCIVERENKKFLAMPRKQADEILDVLTQTIKDRDVYNLAIVVRMPGLRRFVRRLVQTRFPLVPVFATAEVERMRLTGGEIDLIPLVSAA